MRKWCASPKVSEDTTKSWEEHDDWSEYLIAPCPPNYVLERGNPEFSLSDFDKHHIWELKDGDLFQHPYRYHLKGDKHTNWVSADTENGALGPIIISAESLPSKVSNNSLYVPKSEIKVLIQTKKGAEKVSLSVKKVELLGLIKAIKQEKPELARVKFNRVKGDSLPGKLVRYEQQIVRTVYKFGVLYCKEGQVDEDDMYNNEHGSDDFHEFLDFIGNKVQLRGFAGYRAGLDVKTDTTGTHSVYTTHIDGCEIMFHVSTYLEFFPLDPQQVERKRHLGNDVVLIIFRDRGKKPNPPFEMNRIHSQFNHVFFVVEPHKRKDGTYYKLSIGAKSGVVPFGPPLSGDPPFIKKNKTSKKWLLSKLINSERAAFHAPDFVMKFRHTRRNQLKNIILSCEPETIKKKSPSLIIRKGARPFATMRTRRGRNFEDPNFLSDPSNFRHIAHLNNGSLDGKLELDFVDLFESGTDFTAFGFASDNEVSIKAPPKPPQAPKPPPSDDDQHSDNEEDFDEFAFEALASSSQLTKNRKARTCPRMKTQQLRMKGENIFNDRDQRDNLISSEDAPPRPVRNNNPRPVKRYRPKRSVPRDQMHRPRHPPPPRPSVPPPKPPSPTGRSTRAASFEDKKTLVAPKDGQYRTLRGMKCAPKPLPPTPPISDSPILAKSSANPNFSASTPDVPSAKVVAPKKQQSSRDLKKKKRRVKKSSNTSDSDVVSSSDSVGHGKKKRKKSRETSDMLSSCDDLVKPRSPKPRKTKNCEPKEVDEVGPQKLVADTSPKQTHFEDSFSLDLCGNEATTSSSDEVTLVAEDESKQNGAHSEQVEQTEDNYTEEFEEGGEYEEGAYEENYEETADYNDNYDEHYHESYGPEYDDYQQTYDETNYDEFDPNYSLSVQPTKKLKKLPPDPKKLKKLPPLPST